MGRLARLWRAAIAASPPLLFILIELIAVLKKTSLGLISFLSSEVRLDEESKIFIQRSKKTSKNFLYIFVQRSKKTSKNINALAAIIQSRFGALSGLAVRSFILISTKKLACDYVT